MKKKSHPVKKMLWLPMVVIVAATAGFFVHKNHDDKTSVFHCGKGAGPISGTLLAPPPSGQTGALSTTKPVGGTKTK